MATIIGRNQFTWRKNVLYRYGQDDPVAEVVPDGKWPGMWRLRLLPDGNLSDMVNLSRAKDAAVVRAMGAVNAKNRRADGGSMRPEGDGAPG